MGQCSYVAVIELITIGGISEHLYPSGILRENFLTHLMVEKISVNSLQGCQFWGKV